MLVGIKKLAGLAAAEIVEICIHPASLHDVSKIKIGLAVPYEVNFFTDQFCAILAPPSLIAGKTAEKQAQK
jgi:hypothetical protein